LEITKTNRFPPALVKPVSPESSIEICRNIFRVILFLSENVCPLFLDPAPFAREE